MISRKERRVQKALGLGEDIPPTIYSRIQYWWWKHITIHTYKWAMDEFWRRLSYKLPKKLIYHCAIRIWAHATSCSSGYGEDVTITTMNDAIKRWDKE
jgi:hypothetical protein